MTNKKVKIDIKELEDFKLILQNIKVNNIFELLEVLKERFNLENEVLKYIKNTLEEKQVQFRVVGLEDYVDYIKCIVKHNEKIENLFNIIKDIEVLYIDRVEFERIVTYKQDVEQEKVEIEKIKDKISEKIEKKQLEKIENLEKSLREKYLYSKDIELLKRIISGVKSEETYNKEKSLKTLKITIPKEVNKNYIKVNLGSIEYHNHLKANLVRIDRLIKNLNKYIEKKDKETIHQSETLQDTINIALAEFSNKEFKAISGKNNIEGYAKVVSIEESHFISKQVNKRGEFGVGYNRINDSEKKLLEEIDREIEKDSLKDSGKLIIYTKWQPCDSCYFVIKQFKEKHPKINVIVKYGEKYGKN